MTDPTAPYEPTPDELLMAAAKAAPVTPDPLPDAADLPSDVKDGFLDDPGEDDPAIADEPPTGENA